MTAKEYLKKFAAVRREADEAEERLRRMNARSRNRMDECRREVEELTDLLIQKTKRCIGMEIEIRERLEKIENDEERTILAYRYIDEMAWTKIASRMHMSERTVYYMHGRALLHFRVPEVCTQLQSGKT